jgi:hypothetical protein
MGKYAFAAAAMLAVTSFAAPAFAQEQAKDKTAQPVPSKPAGAASASYARCAPGSPIGGIVVKGGVNPTRRNAETEGDCPSTASTPDEHRTYTGGRRNEETPSASAEANATALPPAGDMPSRLSMTPTTAKAAAEPPVPTGKSISEQGVAASRPH